MKLYAWEPCFEQKVLDIRGKEISVLRSAVYLNAATSFICTRAFFATEISACRTLTPTVDDAISNIAVVFHWPPQAYADMTLSQMMQWHQKAIERNGSDAE